MVKSASKPDRSMPSLLEREECNGSWTGAGCSAVCLRAKGQRELSFREREAWGGLGAEMGAWRVTACLGVTGGGKETVDPRRDMAGENGLHGDPNASRN